MAGEWTQHKVSELIEHGALIVGDGYRAKNSELNDSGLPFARAGNVNAGFLFSGTDCFPEKNLHHVGNKVSQPGDVVFTSKGTVGRFAFVRLDTPRFVYSPQLCFWRSVDRELIDPRFLSFWMSGREFYIQFKGVAGQTDMAEYVSLADQRRMHITLPPLPEQRAIARILGTLDDKIELNRQMNETLEAMARALFKSWFIDFDPVRRNADRGRNQPSPRPTSHPSPIGRGDGDEGVVASEAYDHLFPDAFEDSELGEIPKGWKVGPILETARLLSGGTPKTDRDEYWSGDIPWASAKDVSQCGNSFLVETERKITARGLDESATQLIPALCSVVVARGATTGRMVVLGDAMAINQTCYALATAIGTPFALYCHLREEIANLVHAAHGSVFDTITTSTFATSKVTIPPDRVFREFERRVDPMFRRVMAGTKASRTLAALRDTLLPKLISGELRVKDAERIVELV